MAGFDYVVRGSGTAGTAAPIDLLSITAAANTRVRIWGIEIGSQAASALAAVSFQLLLLSVDVTGSAFTPMPLDQEAPTGAAAHGGRPSKATAKNVVTVNGTLSKVLDEFSFDAVSRLWRPYPQGKGIWFGDSQIVALRKTVGSDTTVWTANVYFEE